MSAERDGHVARGWRLRRALGLASAAVLLLTGPPVRAADAAVPCRGELILAARAYYVGEQILHRVRLERSADSHAMRWAQPPVFPDFRVETLPGRAEQRMEGADANARHTAYYVREQHRALFPARAGSLVIPASGLECRSEPGGRTFRASLPALSVEVQRPPDAGQPDDYAGLVGNVALDVTADAQSVALGAALELSVVMRGDANLWDQPAPTFEQPQPGDAARFDVYPGAARIDLERGTALAVRSTRNITLVPREAGTLRIPALRVVSFEPDRQRYAVARSAPIAVRVVAAPNDGRAPATPAPTTLDRGLRGERKLPLWALALAVATLAALGVGAARRTRRRSAPLRAAAREALAAADAPERVRAAALERALRLTLEARPAPGTNGETLETQSRVSLDPLGQEILDTIARLEQLRFDREPPPVDLDEIEQLLGTAHAHASLPRGKP